MVSVANLYERNWRDPEETAVYLPGIDAEDLPHIPRGELEHTLAMLKVQRDSLPLAFMPNGVVCDYRHACSIIGAIEHELNARSEAV